MDNNKDKIISLIRQKGPCLPSDINKELEKDVLIASAMLGELVSVGILELTNLKRASSPYYYLKEQKEKLQSISQFLNEKDKIAYNLIKEKIILKDSDQTPLIRVALRTIKDYASPFQIDHDGQTILFWKWYLLSDKEAEEKIKQLLGAIKQKHREKKYPKTTLKKEPKLKTAFDASTPFLDQINKYFNKNNINVVSQEVMNKKKTEIDFIVEIPSAVGKLQYYCKAKNKKKINDSDLASAFVQGQQKKLPVLVLINGDMTKKAQEMLNKEFQRMKVYKM